MANISNMDPGIKQVLSFIELETRFLPKYIPDNRKIRFIIATKNNANIIVVILDKDTATPIAKESIARAMPNKIASLVSITPEIFKSTFEGSLNILITIPRESMLMTAIDWGFK